MLTVSFDRAAQEAVDQRSSLLRAAGEYLGKTVRAGFGAALPFPLALLPLGLAGVALAGILLAGAVVPVLVAKSPHLVAVGPDPAEPFERRGLLARSRGELFRETLLALGPELHAIGGASDGGVIVLTVDEAGFHRR